ncbi:CcdC family protein [Desmospora profundinema]|uniref:Membrane protein CcdC involved in cytochrome C biogenesis n=1 Tax=Desmospora profundinema TaxID=1571184 RepID=A0ABU1IJW8_9BACL|nr:cytochrome c biogenesis protein CcdC [Desmospora profundinema]MDR6225079.1 membrane protein CcdC involved in cytochrome C biogenesis [Desmospora profundinema]
MGFPFGLNPQWITWGTLVMAGLFLFVRLRAARHPTNGKKIIMPPLGMSTGFLMFLYPPAQIPLSWGIAAFLTGAFCFSLPLIYTSRFEVVGRNIYLKRSKAFVWILLILLAIRMLAHEYVEHLISLEQTAGVFFILAFGMLLPWRLAMYREYTRLRRGMLLVEKGK